MSLRFVSIATSLVLLATPALSADEAAATPPQDTGCNGKIVGAVTGTFRCTVKVQVKDGKASFVVKPEGAVKGLKGLDPASFTLKMPITAQTYTHRDIAAASASATSDGGKKFKSSEKLGDRGDFQVTFVSVEKNRGGNLGIMRTHAHLVPADAKDAAELQVDVEATVGW
jgi:hypothetical protein